MHLTSDLKDLQASTLVRLNWEDPILDPLAVQHLNNQLFMNDPQVLGGDMSQF